MTQGVLDKDGVSGVNDSDSDEDAKGGRTQALLDLKVACFETLGKAWPSDASTQAEFQEALVAQCLRCLSLSTRPVQVAILASLARFVDKLRLLDPDPSADDSAMDTDSNEAGIGFGSLRDEAALQHVLDDVAQAVEFALGVVRHTRLRAEALNVLLVLGRKLTLAAQDGLCATARANQLAALAQRFRAQLEAASADSTPEIKSRVVDVKNVLVLRS